MNSKPLVSIITPSLNQGKFIEETIKSIINQTYKNIEYIIIDGDSTDCTKEVISKYLDKINIYISERDSGQSNAINKGFKMAKGELVGWLNSDDYIYQDCIEKIVELYQENNDGAVYCNSLIDWVDDRSSIINTKSINIVDREYLLNVHSAIIQPGSFYPRKLVEKVGYLDEELHYSMDLDLWLRLLKYGNIYGLKDSPHVAFRIYPGSKTDTGKLKFLKDIKEVLIRNGAKIKSKSILKGYYLLSIKSKIKNSFFNE